MPECTEPKPSTTSESAAESPALDERETELLLLLARAELSAEDEARVLELVDQDVDWRSIDRAMAGHGTTATAYPHLHRLALEAMPAATRRVMQHTYHWHRIRAELLIGGMGSALDALTAAGVETVTIKGPALAAQAYGDAWSRGYNDIDLLIRPHDIRRLCEVLVELGHTQSVWPWPLTGAAGRALRTWGKELPFSSSDGRVSLDVHWRLADAGLRCAPDIDRAWSRLVTVRIAERDVLTTCREDSLLAAVSHGMSHSWARMRWLCDVAEMVRRHKDLDWDLVLGEARARKTATGLHAALLLARDLLEAPVPEPVLAEARGNEGARRLAEMTSPLNRAPGTMPGESEVFAVETLARDTSAARARVRLAWLWSRLLPTRRDWDFVALPGWLLPLYAVLRPVRLALGK